MNRIVHRLGASLAVLALAASGAAHAQPSSPPAAPAPWEQGVDAATQDRANALFAEGNALFADEAHAPALDKYRAAIALWDHPLIRFNLAVTLVRLDRPLEAADELERALRFGAAPFSKALYQQALDYRALLAGRIGTLEVTCDHAGAQVTLDGKPWFACPGTQQQRVIVGEHAVGGELKGYFVDGPPRLSVAGGVVTHKTLRLRSIESAVQLRYRYPRWVPYAITGAGAALGIAGVATYFTGRNQLEQFYVNFDKECGNRCTSDWRGDHPALAAQHDSAVLKGDLGLGFMISGGAVLAGGVAMIILNRPTRVMPELHLAPTDGGMAGGARWSW